MIDLKHAFPAHILQRGEAYFSQGRVLELRETPGGYAGIVQGSQRYGVKVSLNAARDSLTGGECSCVYGGRGLRCKHMAALCLAANAREEEAAQPAARDGERTVPLLPPPDPAPERDDYRSAVFSYNLPAILDGVRLTPSEDQAVEELIRGGQIILERPCTLKDYFGARSLQLTGRLVTAHGGSYVTLLLDQERLRSRECLHPACQKARRLRRPGDFSLCPHMCAVLRMGWAWLRRNPLDDTTDDSTIRLIRQFSRGGQAGAAEPAQARQPAIRLTPRLEVADSRLLQVSFKVGEGRMYIVRDLNALMTAEASRAEISYGVQGRLDFARVTFDADSAPLADWIRSALTAGSFAREVDRYGNSHVAVAEQAGSIPLRGAALDRFFELMSGRTLTLGAGRGGPVALRDGGLDIRVEITPIRQRDRFMGVLCEGAVPGYHAGERYVYHLRAGELIRTPKEALSAVAPLMRAAPYGEFSFQVGRPYLKAFYTHVLPALRRFCQVTEAEAEAVAPFLPPEPAFVFRLDAEEAAVSCQAAVTYGEAEQPLLDETAAYRDAEAEGRVADTLGRFFPERAGNVFRIGKEDSRLMDALTAGVDALSGLGQVLVTDRFQAMRIHRRWKLSVGVSMQSDLLSLELLSDSFTPEELREVLAAFCGEKAVSPPALGRSGGAGRRAAGRAGGPL